MAGVRITTYFADDVDRVAETLQSEFEIDQRSSIDKRQYSDPDRFGYQSLHYVLSLQPKRAELAEYAKYRNLKCEVQVRSILQHAWAEIEHDLGYKSTGGVPFSLRRRFARIAGLFELADDEFQAIRDSLKGYEKSLPEKIRVSPASVDLDLLSLKTLFSLPSTLTGLDDAVVRGAGATLVNSGHLALDSFVERLQDLEIKSIEQLERVAVAEMANVEAFSRYWVKAPLGTVLPGIGLFYLIYVLYWRSKDRQKIMHYLNKHAVGGSVADRKGMADRILNFQPAKN
ncbi:putative GTP pyrophosphokinase [Variovorax sp. W2I14]